MRLFFHNIYRIGSNCIRIHRNYTIVFNNSNCNPHQPLNDTTPLKCTHQIENTNQIGDRVTANDLWLDVVVVGGGHAGTEAAAAAARMGATTALITHTWSTTGEMSCNPSFGGIGKGHLMREVDALDGLCARAADESGVHYCMLNKKKGPAVWGPRAQIDRKLYRAFIQQELSTTSNLLCLEAAVEDLIIGWSGGDDDPLVTQGGDDDDLRCHGVILSDGSRIHSKAVVMTTGTFLKAEILIGQESWPAGRLNCDSSIGLANTLQRLGVRLGRLKTGTPPRLLKSSIDFSRLTVNHPDHPPTPFSYMNERVRIEPEQQLPCHLTHTCPSSLNPLISSNIHLNRMIDRGTTGPRYCPSIESKALKFPGLQHQVWVEPEGLDSELVYPQGLSCTMPRGVQQDIIRSIPGLEKAEIAVHGYGVEYDMVDPLQLNSSLHLLLLPGLFLAGQINGTTGYEEAAAQGIVAGINAALRSKQQHQQQQQQQQHEQQQQQRFILHRHDSYTGVMIDDLTTQGVTEPYRMLTARAEYRMILRQDNADVRLTAKGHSVGCVGEDRYRKANEMKSKLDEIIGKMQDSVRTIKQWRRELNGVDVENHSKKSLFSLFSGHLSAQEVLRAYPTEYPLLRRPEVAARVKFEAMYSGVQRRQEREAAEVKNMLTWSLPSNLDYNKIGLSMEAREKLQRVKPETLGAASRIEGVTPAAIVNLYKYALKNQCE